MRACAYHPRAACRLYWCVSRLHLSVLCVHERCASLSEKDVLEGDGDSVCGVNGLAGGGEPAFSNGLVYECTCLWFYPFA